MIREICPEPNCWRLKGECPQHDLPADSEAAIAIEEAERLLRDRDEPGHDESHGMEDQR